MIQTVIRPAKRFAVLIPGLLIAYFSVRNIFPYFDRRLPLAIAILTTYALGAYVLTPAVIRAYRTFRPAKHLPLYCVTPDGFASDPLNIGIFGTRRELIQSMEKSGWYVADRHSIRNVIHQGLSIVYGWTYNTGPVSNLYLFGRKQDIAFEIPIPGQPGHRHHVRFWATTYNSREALNIKAIDWHHRKEHVFGDNLLWVGAASQDNGIAFIRHNMQITHMIHPDTNQERSLIVSLLRKQNLVKKVDTIKLQKPYKLINRAMSGSLHADGKMDIVSLKSSKKA